MLRYFCMILSYLALAGVLLAPILFFVDALDKPTMKAAMAAATFVWFVCGSVVRARSLSSGS